MRVFNNHFVCTVSQNRSTINEHFLTYSVKKSEKQENHWYPNSHQQWSWEKFSPQRLCHPASSRPNPIRSSHHPAKCWWNIRGKITHYILINIVFDDQRLQIKLLVTNIRRNNMILGLPWLKENNPRIDWKTRQIKLTKQQTVKKQIAAIAQWELQKIEERKPREGSPVIVATLEYEWTPETNKIWVNAKTSIAQKLAMKETEKQKMKTLDNMIPHKLVAYQNVFDKKKAKQFPKSRSWDHAIDLKPDFVPKDCKVYPLTPQEHTEIDKFINKNLTIEYIRSSKLPMALPFFFVAKNSGDLRPCQDYWQLNEGTIKNSYPLLLISKLVDQLKGARYFTKLDVWWGYNNIRIKDGDQWKAAFKTSHGLFELTVMFFGMCNSPATFQAMMDDIFCDMKTEGWIIIYMDDIFIFTRNLEQNIQCTM